MERVTYIDIFFHRFALAKIGVETATERSKLVKIFENTFGEPATYIIPDDIWDTEETE